MKAATMVLDPKDGLLVEQTIRVRGPAKGELLDLAVKTHGGLDRWNKVKNSGPPRPSGTTSFTTAW